ncbi:hypothetical protein [Sinomicrobium weinanense]|uniref:Uncharacterized protein n=1 Tax=Sinomicrobium weinanense TaxID=2842200 RepID=A0A926JUG7_9FLAO|nr:hypothetical protein [Sinomicrobium weinanense]MBC9797596.1 hypothetical protein [Sinomicrobium weinanense]MBU3123663.1 hypothetical protein [Sinomicrobium weinanense]
MRVNNEEKRTIVLSIGLIGFNVLSIYLVIQLLGYDEILNYPADGSIERESPKGLAWLLFINGMCNLLYVVVVLMARLMNPDKN